MKTLCIFINSVQKGFSAERIALRDCLRDNHLAHFLKMLSVSLQYDKVLEQFKFRRDPYSM